MCHQIHLGHDTNVDIQGMLDLETKTELTQNNEAKQPAKNHGVGALCRDPGDCQENEVFKVSSEKVIFDVRRHMVGAVANTTRNPWTASWT